MAKDDQTLQVQSDIGERGRLGRPGFQRGKQVPVVGEDWLDLRGIQKWWVAPSDTFFAANP